MCQHCVEHGHGKKWFLEARNYLEKHIHDDKEREELVHATANLIAEKVPRPSSFLFTTGMTGLSLESIVEFDLKGSWEQLEHVLNIKIPAIDKLDPAIDQINSIVRKFHKKVGLRDYSIKKLNELLEKNHFGQVMSLEETKKALTVANDIQVVECFCKRRFTGEKEQCCLAVGAFADYIEKMPKFIKHKKLSVEEAQEFVEKQEMEKGKYHSIWNLKSPFLALICNCDCSYCDGFKLTREGVNKAMIPGHQLAHTIKNKCTDCGACVVGCPFGARIQVGGIVITDKSRCTGCGICRNVCPENAIRMVERGDQPLLR